MRKKYETGEYRVKPVNPYEYHLRDWPDIVVTLILMLLNIGVAVYGLFRDGLEYDWAILTEAVSGGEYFRVVTSMFVHFGLEHLLFNMIALFGVGRILERLIGHVRFAIVYIASGLCGSAMVMYLTEDFGVYTAGASGAIFGIMAALFVYMLLTKDFSMIQQVALMLIINLAGTFTGGDVSVGGHIGGCIGGLILGMLFVRKKDSKSYNF